jgi:hypothetical protein
LNFRYRKSSQAKKIKTISRSEEDLRQQKITVLHEFAFSLPLINLLRDPDTDGHDFAASYLAKVAGELRRINPSEGGDFDETVVYLHLILAQVDNLYEMEELGRAGGEMAKFNADKWNHTNIMNAKCLLASLHHHRLLPKHHAPKVHLSTPGQDLLEEFQGEAETAEQSEASTPR